MIRTSASIRTLIEGSMSDQIDPTIRPELPAFDEATMTKIGSLSQHLKRAVCFADNFASWQPPNHDQEGRKHHKHDIAEAWQIIKEMIRQELDFDSNAEFTICGDWTVSITKT